MRKDGGSLARWALLSLPLAALFAMFALAAARAPTPGTPDSVNAALVSRNLLAGRGYTVDCIHYLCLPYESVSHPDDAFELVYPTLAAGVVSVLGDRVVSFRLVNMVIMAFVLPLATFHLARRRVSAAWAVTAAAIVAFSAAGWFVAAAAVNDGVAAVAILLAAALTVDYCDKGTFGSFAALGLVVGLGVMSKASTAPLVAPLVLYALVLARRVNGPRRAAACAAILVAVAGAAYSPFAIRNEMTFGSPRPRLQAYLLPRAMGTDDPEIYFRPTWLDETAEPQPFDRAAYASSVVTNARAFLGLVKRHLGLLALLGALLALRGEARWPLVALLLTGTGLVWYSAIHHFEYRYFIHMVAPLAIAATFACSRMTDFLAAARPRFAGWCAPVAVTVAVTAFAGYQRADWTDWWAYAFGAPARQASALALVVEKVVDRSTAADSIVMTRVVEEVNYLTGRRCVTPPAASMKAVLTVAQRYGATYFLATPRHERGSVIEPLYEGRPVTPFRLVGAAPEAGVYLYSME